MRNSLTFAKAALGLIAVALAATWLLLDPASWRWVAIAAGIAMLVQGLLHLLLPKWRKDPKRFVAGILLGTTVRTLTLVVAIVWVWQTDHRHPVALLLGLAGFLFGLLLIEAGLENRRAPRAGRAADVHPRQAEPSSSTTSTLKQVR